MKDNFHIIETEDKLKIEIREAMKPIVKFGILFHLEKPPPMGVVMYSWLCQNV